MQDTDLRKALENTQKLSLLSIPCLLRAAKQAKGNDQIILGKEVALKLNQFPSSGKENKDDPRDKIKTFSNKLFVLPLNKVQVALGTN